MAAPAVMVLDLELARALEVFSTTLYACHVCIGKLGFSGYNLVDAPRTKWALFEHLERVHGLRFVEHSGLAWDQLLSPEGKP